MTSQTLFCILHSPILGCVVSPSISHDTHLKVNVSWEMEGLTTTFQVLVSCRCRIVSEMSYGWFDGCSQHSIWYLGNPLSSTFLCTTHKLSHVIFQYLAIWIGYQEYHIECWLQPSKSSIWHLRHYSASALTNTWNVVVSLHLSWYISLEMCIMRDGRAYYNIPSIGEADAE